MYPFLPIIVTLLKIKPRFHHKSHILLNIQFKCVTENCKTRHAVKQSEYFFAVHTNWENLMLESICNIFIFTNILRFMGYRTALGNIKRKSLCNHKPVIIWWDTKWNHKFSLEDYCADDYFRNPQYSWTYLTTAMQNE